MLGSQLSNILSQWGGPIHDGSRSSDVHKRERVTFREVMYFMRGNVKSCFQKLYDSRETWKWDDFKKFLIHVDGELSGACVFFSLLMCVFFAGFLQ